MIIKNSLIPKILKVNGIVIYPFVLFSEKNPDQYLINHELIHVHQIKSLGVFRFYFNYLKEYFYYRSQKLSHYQAYMAISYEREAYENERNLNYLEQIKIS